jgi:uncharacterized membrane protein YfcA
MLAFLPALLRGQPVRGRAGRGLPAPLQHAGFLLMGVYAGAVQAGLGIALLPVLVVLAGLDLVRANAAKVAIIAAQQVLSLAVFAWAGKVWWLHGLALALGSGAGGYAASRLGARAGERLVRPVVAGVVLAVAAWLLMGS